MASVRDLIVLRQDSAKKRAEDDKNEFQAKLIRRDGSVVVEGRPQWVNYQPIGGGNPGIAFNLGRVAEQVGIQVIVGFEGTTRVPVILGKDPTAAQDQTMTSPDFAQHGMDHRYMGKDSMAIDLRQLQELMVLPKGSFVVAVLAGRYGYQGERKYFGGHTGLDLSLFQPASGKRAVGLYLDTSNTLQSVNGNVVAESASPIPEPDWPNDCTFQVAICVLHSNKSFVDKEDIKNRKIIWGSETEIPRCLIDAKGDIVVGTADDAVSRLPVGTNGQFLTADSTVASGTAWTTDTDGWPFDDVITVSATNPSADHITIAAAITAASAGQVILLDAGTYIETLTVNKAITIMGLDSETTEITTATAASTTVNVTTNGAVLRTLTVSNTGAGASQSALAVSADITTHDVIVRCTGAATTNNGIFVFSGTSTFYNSDILVSGATTNRGLIQSTAGSTVELQGGKIDGASFDIVLGHAGATCTITNTLLVNGTVDSTLGTFNGTLQDAILVSNGSGVTAITNDLGYLDEAGDYQETTDEGDNVAWCVVVIGNVNGENIFVKRRGNVVVNYVGGAPSAGDFLITSTTGGSATQKTTMHPAICAVCTANGAGGTVAVQLMTGTVTRMFTAVTDTVRVFTSSDSDFVATINGAPVLKDVIYNAPTSGSDDTIDPLSSAEVGKIVLHNTTPARTPTALISDVNRGASTITLTENAPGDWANGDGISARSLTVTGALIGTSRAYDLDLSGFLPELVRSASFSLFHAESTPGANNFSFLQEFSTSAPSFSLGDLVSAAVVGGIQAVKLSPHQIFDKKVCFLVSASGVATSGIIVRIRSIDVATP